MLTATATGCKSLARGVRGYIHVHAIDASLQSLAQNLDLESGSVKRVLPLRLFDSTIHLSSERMSFLSDRVFSAWAFLVQSLYSRQKVYTPSLYLVVDMMHTIMLAECLQSLCSRQRVLVPSRLTTVQITPSSSETYSQQYSHSFYGCRWLYPPLRKEASLCNLASSHGTNKTCTRAFPRAPQS